MLMDKLPNKIMDTLNSMERTPDKTKEMIVAGNRDITWMYSKERYCYLIFNGYSIEIISSSEG
jgi:hypothetical protein